VSRYPREYSETGIYHVMLRGNERKDIFIDHFDKEKFLFKLFDVKKNNAFTLYAYCIMGNHVHLIIKEENGKISSIMKKIAIRYAQYFNNRYNRVGHVFQDRFKSAPIENEVYLLSAIRYVHNNPEKAGISKKETYQWSSYSEYINILSGKSPLPEIEEILDMFSSNRKKGVKEFINYSSESDKNNFLDILEKKEFEISEKNVLDYINGYLKSKNLTKEDLIKKKYKKQREDLIQRLIRKSDLSKRKIAFYCGINRETVRMLSQEPSP